MPLDDEKEIAKLDRELDKKIIEYKKIQKIVKEIEALFPKAVTEVKQTWKKQSAEEKG